MSSLPSKNVLQISYPSLSPKELDHLWNLMFKAAQNLAEYNLRDSEVVIQGHSVLTMAAVMMRNGAMVRDVTVYGDSIPLALYVDAGIDVPSLIYFPRARAFEIHKDRYFLADTREIMEEYREES